MTKSEADVHIGFFASAKSGLGHVQRVSNIAVALRAGGFAGRLSSFCNAACPTPAGTGRQALDDIVVIAREDMAAAARAQGVNFAVSDMMVVPGLETVGQKRALILRETPLDPVAKFALDGVPWDHVLIPNPVGNWSPALPAHFARHVLHVGWIRRRTTARLPEDAPAGVVLATGGGGTPETREALYPVLSRIVQRARLEVPFELRQALGPRAAGQALPEADRTFDPGQRLDDTFRRANVVISTAGYNSVLELAGTDTPTLLAAIPRSFDDQQARVRVWGPQLGHGLEPGGEEAAAAWLADHLAHPRRRPPVDLGVDGAVMAARALAHLS